MPYIGQAPANKPLSSSDLEDGLITNSKLAQDIISGETELATAPADTDEFLISDAGTLKRIDASLIGGGGKIGQVKNTDSQVNTNISSDAELISLAITPSATSSKIFILFSGTAQLNGNEYASWDFYRGSLSSGTKILDGGETVFNGNDTVRLGFSMHFLDSPNTTSATTYTVVGAPISSTVQYGATARNTLTLMEVLA